MSCWRRSGRRHRNYWRLWRSISWRCRWHCARWVLLGMLLLLLLGMLLLLLGAQVVLARALCLLFLDTLLLCLRSCFFLGALFSFCFFSLCLISGSGLFSLRLASGLY